MTVHPFACNRPHPQYGDTAICERQRFHAGDHRGTRAEKDGSRLVSWPDTPAPAAAPIVDVSDGTDLPDDWTVTELEGQVGHVRDPLWVAALLVLVAVLIAAPAVLVILYRGAF